MTEPTVTPPAPSGPPPTGAAAAAGAKAAAAGAAAAKGGSSVILWVLAIVGGLGLLAIAAVVGIGYYAYTKVKAKAQEMGLADADGNLGELDESGMAFAAMKFQLSQMPDCEIVSSDPVKKEITYRNTKTGQVVTMNVKDMMKGRLTTTVEGEGTSTLEMPMGDNGLTLPVLNVEGRNGTHMRFGEGVKVEIPAWMPPYPGSKPVGQLSSNEDGKEFQQYGFGTGDGIEAVLAYYGPKLKAAGFEVESDAAKEGGEATGGWLNARTPDGKRNVTIGVSAAGSETRVDVTLMAEP